MKIALLRKSKNITQAELALSCGTTQQQIARIENGVVDPRLSTLQRIADALDCELKDLFYSHKEFLDTVLEVIAAQKIDLKKCSLLELNNFCTKEKLIPSFHPLWEKVVIKNNKVLLSKE